MRKSGNEQLKYEPDGTIEKCNNVEKLFRTPGTGVKIQKSVRISGDAANRIATELVSSLILFHSSDERGGLNNWETGKMKPIVEQ